MKKDPFKNPLMVQIYECGDTVSSINPAYIEIDLNAWRKKYYLYGQKREHLEAESLIKLQREFFGQLVNEILDHTSIAMQLKREEIRDTNHEDLFPPNQAPNQQNKDPIPKKDFLFLFTNEGKRVKNVLDIPENVQYLLVSEKKRFRDIVRNEPKIDTNYTNHYTLKQKVLNY